jgi:hypothetical protein
MNTDRRLLIKAENKIMKTTTTSNWRPLPRTLYALLLCIAALCAMPKSACAQQLYVGQYGNSTVGLYDASTGAAINANLITTGLNGPNGFALSGNNLFVANYDDAFGENGGTTVGEYNLTTGAFNPTFIRGLDGPDQLAFSGNNLFVSNFLGGTVGVYNFNTGAAINASFIGGLSYPAGLAVVPEPSAWSMIAVGGVALLGIICRKKRRSA